MYMYRCLDGSPFVHRLMPLCRTKGTDILIAVECALQRQIVRKRGFLFSRYERICFVTRKEEKLGYFLCRFGENFYYFFFNKKIF